MWAETEPCMGVICACIPSLRPLVSLILRSLPNAPVIGSKSRSANMGSPKWKFGISQGFGCSKGKDCDRTFSRLNEQRDHPTKLLGHNVSVRGGRLNGTGDPGDCESWVLPPRGIQVKTEVVLVSSERLNYQDRLF